MKIHIAEFLHFEKFTKFPLPNQRAHFCRIQRVTKRGTKATIGAEICHVFLQNPSWYRWQMVFTHQHVVHPVTIFHKSIPGLRTRWVFNHQTWAFNSCLNLRPPVHPPRVRVRRRTPNWISCSNWFWTCPRATWDEVGLCRCTWSARIDDSEWRSGSCHTTRYRWRNHRAPHGSNGRNNNQSIRNQGKQC